MGGLWKWIGDNGTAIGVVIAVSGVAISFVALLVSLPRIKRWLNGEPMPPPPVQPGADRDRTAMLTKIRTNWVEPWLERDLYQQARLELQLTEREDAVQTRLRSYSQTGGEPGPEIPRDKAIEEIFDAASGQLLILGEPGTGKSTKLVELARALLDRAGADASEPIPVILNLSSWTKKQADLGEWIQSELVRLYGVSRPRARQWVEGEKVVPLLDGLDEVAAERRGACVEAINTYRRDHGLWPMAVCCRLDEYHMLPVPLDFAGAVAVEPLERKEVESYLNKHGPKVRRVRQALRDDPGLWDLMNTPLMLTVLFLASEVEGKEARSEPDPRRRLYLRFVRKMFGGPRSRRFGKKKALCWLGWLAAQLVNRDQIPFALEDLDLEWLPSRRARRAASVILALFVGLFAWLLVGLVVGLMFGLVGGLVGGLGVGLMFGLVGGLVGGLGASPVDALGIDWRRLPQALVLGLGGVLVGGLLLGLGGMLVGLLVGKPHGVLGGVLYGGLLLGLFVGLSHILRPAAVSERSAANEGTSRSLRYALRISSAGVVLAIAVAWLLSVLRGGLEGAMSDAVEAATAAAPVMVAWLSVLLALQKGGYFFLGHWAVRAQLQRLDLAPRHYVEFLDETAAMLFLRKTGGTYQFFHVTFRDFVAETYGAEWLAKDRRPPPPSLAA